jgi:hypothetical protein
MFLTCRPIRPGWTRIISPAKGDVRALSGTGLFPGKEFEEFAQRQDAE